MSRARPWRGRLRALGRLDRHGFGELFAAQWQLLVAQWLVWRRPTGTFLSPRAGAVSGEPGDQEVEAALRLAQAIQRAARHGVFRPACLVRSLALHRLLEGRGVAGSRLRIGVRLEDEKFEAHAWVELGELVLGDHPDHVRRFDELSELRLRGG